MDKTNVMRILDQKKISYIPYEYDPNIVEGVIVANILHQPLEKVFKTLVTQANTKNYYVFIIPVAETLNLKKAAKIADVKSIAMIKQKELLPLTGYIHGGCSPIGMKKQFNTYIHESAKDLDTFCISAGKTGHQVEIKPSDLSSIIHCVFGDLI